MPVASHAQQQKPTRRLPPTPHKMGPVSRPLLHLLNQRPAYAVPVAAIHFVATSDEWLRCAERLRAAVVLGLDTETKPEFRKLPPGRKTNPCSLLQIATRDALGAEEVFVLDLLALSPKLYNAALADVFLSKRVLKLGQGFYHDLQELALSYPSATCFHVAKYVVEVNDLSMALLDGGHLPLSLQKLVFLYLDRKLTKTQQTSNWNRRPLAASQLHYAAADALVLIHLYDELMTRMALARQDFQLESVANVLDVHVPPLPKCTLCSSSFASTAVLKTHRNECVATVHTLEVCAGCDARPLTTTEAMRQHLSECNSAIASGDASCVVVRLMPKAQAKKKAKSEKVITTTAAAAAAPASSTSSGSRKRSRSEAAAAANETQTPELTKKQAKKLRQRANKLMAEYTGLAVKESGDTGQPASPGSAKQTLELTKRQAKKLLAHFIEVAKTKAAAELPAPPDSAESAAADAAESKSARKRRRQQERKKAEATAAQQKLKQNQKPKPKQKSGGVRPTPARKMSVESSLLASDAIWSQVSTDYSSSLFSP